MFRIVVFIECVEQMYSENVWNSCIHRLYRTVVFIEL